jgi:hypothetical protein
VIQFRPDFRDTATWAGLMAIGVLATFVALLAAMLVCLWLSIRPHAFDLATPDVDMLAFVQASVAAALGQDGRVTAEQATGIRDAVRDRLLNQWAISASANRRTNRRREDHRERAGRFLLLSIATILVLIGFDVAQSIMLHVGGSGDAGGTSVQRRAGG